MAIQGSYGREIALRANELLQQLEQHARDVPGEMPSAGSLRPSFLLSMAMPIIIQPYERFFSKGAQRSVAFYSEFERLDGVSEMRNEIDSLKTAGSLAGSPMEVATWWWAFTNDFYKLSDGIPNHIAPLLTGTAGKTKAKTKAPHEILMVLRHALAHGSVIYLDKNGEPSLYGGVTYFLFVNQRTDDMGNQKSVDFLKVSVEDFRKFLSKWANWIERHLPYDENA